jgi:hypothetical protein
MIAEILLKVALNTKNQSINPLVSSQKAKAKTMKRVPTNS